MDTNLQNSFKDWKLIPLVIGITRFMHWNDIRRFQTFIEKRFINTIIYDII